MPNKKKSCSSKCKRNKSITVLIILFTVSLTVFSYLITKNEKAQIKEELHISEKQINQAKQAEIEMQEQVNRLQKKILNGEL